MKSLAIQACGGDETARAALWEAVRRLGYKIAGRYYEASKRNVAVDADDLQQCAALAFYEALKTFDPAGCSFSTWYGFYVRNECRIALGLHTSRPHLEHYGALRLDAPIGEDEEITLLDTLQDDACISDDEIVERIALSDMLHAALNRLPADEERAIRWRYLDEMPLEEVEARVADARNCIRRGKDHLRRDYRLRREYEDCYRTKGLKAFLSTHSSVVEDEVLRRCEMFDNWR